MSKSMACKNVKAHTEVTEVVTEPPPCCPSQCLQLFQQRDWARGSSSSDAFHKCQPSHNFRGVPALRCISGILPVRTS